MLTPVLAFKKYEHIAAPASTSTSVEKSERYVMIYRVCFKFERSEGLKESIAWARIVKGSNRACFQLEKNSSTFDINAENDIFANVWNISELWQHKKNLVLLLQELAKEVKPLSINIQVDISTSGRLDICFHNAAPLITLSKYFTYVGDWNVLNEGLEVPWKNALL